MRLACLNNIFTFKSGNEIINNSINQSWNFFVSQTISYTDKSFYKISRCNRNSSAG